LVCDLFLLGTRQWDEQAVRNTLCAIEAEEILKLRPGARLPVDIDAWAYEKNGMFFVRSCYRLLKHESGQKEAFKLNEPGSSMDSTWWRKVWNLQVPPKVRIFWWRVLQGFLPSKSELKRRHVAKENHCEACGEEDESIFHVAVRCTVAVRFR
jgi:hypothetical protein